MGSVTRAECLVAGTEKVEQPFVLARELARSALKNALNAFHQFGNRDFEPIGQGFQHGQAGASFAIFHFRDMAPVDPEPVGHFALAQPGFFPQIADPLAEPCLYAYVCP